MTVMKDGTRKENPKRKDRKPGSLKGRIWMSPDFNDPCPEIEEMFYVPDEDDLLFGDTKK